MPARLDLLADREVSEELRIQKLYPELNDEVYRLYGIPDSTRATIEETLGRAPTRGSLAADGTQEVEQKRMEHVFRCYLMPSSAWSNAMKTASAVHIFWR